MSSWGGFPGGYHVRVGEILDEPERFYLAAVAIHGGYGAYECLGLYGGPPYTNFVPKSPRLVAKVADDVFLENCNSVDVDRCVSFFTHFKLQGLASLLHEEGTSNSFMGTAYV